MRCSHRLLTDLREARLDLARGFLRLTLASDPHSPFRREEGMALLDQAIAVLKEVETQIFPASALRLESSELVRTFQDKAQDFRGQLTAYHRPEAAPRASESRFRNLVERAPEGIFVQSDGEFLFVNLPMMRLLGATQSADLIGQSVLDRIAPEFRDRVLSRIRTQIESGGSVPPMAQEYLRLDGSRVAVETTAVPAQFEDRAAHLVFVRDITERKRAEERLRQVSELQAALHHPATLSQKLERITHAIVDIFDADFARIWLMGPGDLCAAGCLHAAVEEGPHVCCRRDQCLHLQASSGRYTHRDGPGHRRVPLAATRLGASPPATMPHF